MQTDLFLQFALNSFCIESAAQLQHFSLYSFCCSWLKSRQRVRCNVKWFAFLTSDSQLLKKRLQARHFCFIYL